MKNVHPYSLRIFTQIFFTALTLFGLLSQEYVAKGETTQFSTFLFSCYENAEEKDADENHAVIRSDFHQPRIGSGGADEDELNLQFEFSGLENAIICALLNLEIRRSFNDSIGSYTAHWLSSFQQPDLLAFLGSRKLFA